MHWLNASSVKLKKSLSCVIRRTVEQYVDTPELGNGTAHALFDLRLFCDVDLQCRAPAAERANLRLPAVPLCRHLTIDDGAIRAFAGESGSNALGARMLALVIKATLSLSRIDKSKYFDPYRLSLIKSL